MPQPRDVPAPLLTVEERAQWDTAGYLLVRGALPAEQVGALRAAMLFFQAEREGRRPEVAPHLGQAGNGRDLCLLQAISFLPELDPLLDHPNVFGKILALMGPYLQVTGSEGLWRYPHENDLHPFHTDGGPSLARIFPHPDSLVLTLKVQFFLTEVSTADCGNMLVVPGSHRTPFPETRAAVAAIRARAVQVLAAPGDAVLFPWSLWHGAAANRSPRTRLSVVLRYAQLWSKPVDYQRLDGAVLARLTPRRRRLLGDLGEGCSPGDYHRPPTGEHLGLILGTEWRDSADALRYARWEALAHDLYADEADQAAAHPGAPQGLC